MYNTFDILIPTGHDPIATNFYISRASGNDSWSCDQTKPCKTIWRAVTLASDGDIIHLNGTDTEQDPYTCQSTQSPGLYINTSLTLIGFGPMPPQIRCSKGTNLTFDGSGNAQQMNVTLSGLLVNESSVYFQDSSANISGCKFVGSKQGVQFVISRRMLCDVLITNSIFVRNNECISVVVNNKRSPSPIIQVNFTLKSSSFSGNVISDSGNSISFTESPDNNRTVNCFIILKNVTFSGNKFSSSGLVFLEFNNGSQYFQLHEVKLAENRPSPNKDVLTDHQGDSEFIFRCTNVNIFVNASNFTSQNARSFSITVSNIFLQINNSSFHGHRVEGSGGVVSVLGSNECKLNISNSSFMNTSTTTNLGRGGAIYAECAKLSCTLQGNNFTGNTALHGSGGAVCLSVLSFVPNNYERDREIHPYKSDFDLVLFIENVTFKRCSAEHGGSLGVFYDTKNVTGVVSISNSRFAFNSAESMGGAFLVTPFFADDKSQRSQITIEGSTFINNTSDQGGAIFLETNNQSSIIIENVRMESNRATIGGGGIEVVFALSVKIRHSKFLKNTVGKASTQVGAVMQLGGALSTIQAEILEITDSLFVSNYALGQYGPYNRGGVGGALALYSALNVTIKDTKFEKNVAGFAAGAVLLSDTKNQTIFQNCSLVDNFALAHDGHIAIYQGMGIVLIQDSIINQTVNKLQLHNGMTYYGNSSFIHAAGYKTVKISNTTVDAMAYSSGQILMKVSDFTDRYIIKDNLTKFICPVGSKMVQVFVTDLVMEKGLQFPNILQLSCSSCEGNSYSLLRGRAVGNESVPGFQCLPCPFGANCTQNILAKRNFWGFKEQHNSTELKFSMCPVGYCNQSNATDFPEYNSCQGNRNGTLCGKCKHDYTETLYSPQCKRSDNCNDYLFWLVALAYVSLMAWYLTFKPPVVPWIKRQILWFKKNEPGNQDINFDKGYMKIVFYFYQAANLFLISGSSQSVIKTKAIEPIVGIFNFKSRSLGGSVCPFPGLTVVTKELFLASYVFGTLLEICAIYGVVCGVQRFRGQGNPSVGPYIGGILQTVLLGYTTLASTSFSLLRCVPIGGKMHGLFYDGNIVCYQWWQYILIGFACGYVIPFVFVLLWGSYKLYGETLSVRKFLLACLLPLPSLIYWSFVFLLAKITGTVAEDPALSPDLKRSLEMVLYDPFKRPEDGNKFSLSWEGVMIGRRLILAAVKSFASDPLSRVLIMSFLSVLFLVHHILTLPFRDVIANITETISLVLIVLLGLVNVFFASFLSLAVQFDDPHFSKQREYFEMVEIVILCFAPALFVLLVVAAAVSQLCRVIGVVFRVVHNVYNYFRAGLNNQTDETRSLVTVAS